MALGVLGQMIAAHETSSATAAGEFLFAGVCAFVTRQLVRTRKAATAVQPLAHERLFACMSAHVRFQVRRLEVVLAAALERALEDASPCVAAGVTCVVGCSRRRGSGGCSHQHVGRRRPVANVAAVGRENDVR